MIGITRLLEDFFDHDESHRSLLLVHGHRAGGGRLAAPRGCTKDVRGHEARDRYNLTRTNWTKTPRRYTYGVDGHGSCSVRICVSHPTGVLEGLFGERAREFSSGLLPREHVLVHDKMDRFPEAMRFGDLSTFDRLCAVYKGPLETLPSALGRLSARSALSIADGVGDQFKHVSTESRFCRDRTKVVSVQSEPREGVVHASLHDTWTARTMEFATSLETRDALAWMVESPRSFRVSEIEEASRSSPKRRCGSFSKR